ncbi:MAG: hypothetical protein ACLPX7_04215 [Xanthobacteraceae bacterium]
MSSVATCQDFHLRRAPLPTSTNASAHPSEGIFRRIFAAFERSRQRRLEQEVGRFIAKHGGRVTDDLERQLSEHFSGSGFAPYRPQRSFRPFLQT